MLRDGAIVLHVLRHELRANLRASALWFVALGLMLALVCALQPALAAGPLAAKISSLPAGVRAALGLEVVDFGRPASYLAVNFTYVALGLGLFGGLLGARLLAKEELLHTAELLYAQPAARTAILGGKALAVAGYALALPAALAVIPLVVLGAIVDRPLEPALVMSLFAACACLALVSAGVGMLVAATLRRARAAANVTLAIVLGAFVLGVLSALAPGLSVLRWASPFKLLESPAIVAAGGLDGGVVALLLAVGVGGALLAVRQYRQRDLHA